MIFVWARPRVIPSASTARVARPATSCSSAGLRREGTKWPVSRKGGSCGRWAAGGLVVPGRVEGEFAQEFACAGVDDADMQVLDQEQDAGSGARAADARSS